MDLEFNLQLFASETTSLKVDVTGDVSYDGSKVYHIGTADTSSTVVTYGLGQTATSILANFMPGKGSISIAGEFGAGLVAGKIKYYDVSDPDASYTSMTRNGAWTGDSVQPTTSVTYSAKNTALFSLSFDTTNLSLDTTAGSVITGTTGTGWTGDYTYTSSITVTGLSLMQNIDKSIVSYFDIASASIQDIKLGGYAGQISLSNTANTGVKIFAQGNATGSQTIAFGEGTGVSFSGTSIQVATGAKLNLINGDATAVLEGASNLEHSKIGAKGDLVGIRIAGNGTDTMNFGTGTTSVDVEIAATGAGIISKLNGVESITFTATSEGTLNLQSIVNSHASISLGTGVSGTKINLAGTELDADSTLFVGTNDGKAANFVVGTKLNASKFGRTDDFLNVSAAKDAVLNFGTGTTDTQVLLDESDSNVQTSLSDVGKITYTATSDGTLTFNKLTGSTATMNVDAENVTFNLGSVTGSNIVTNISSAGTGATVKFTTLESTNATVNVSGDNAKLDFGTLTGSTASVSVADGVTGTAMSLAGINETSSFLLEATGGTAQFLKGSQFYSTGISSNDDVLKLYATTSGSYNFGSDTSGVDLVLNANGITVDSSLSGVEAITYTAASANGTLNLTGVSDSNVTVNLNGTNVTFAVDGLTSSSAEINVTEAGASINLGAVTGSDASVSVAVGKTASLTLTSMSDSDLLLTTTGATAALVDGTGFAATNISAVDGKLTLEGTDDGVYNFSTGTSNAEMTYEGTVQTSLTGNITSMTFTAVTDNATLDITGLGTGSDANVVLDDDVTKTTVSAADIGEDSFIAVSKGEDKKAVFNQGSTFGNTSFTATEDELAFSAVSGGVYNLGTGTSNANMHYTSGTVKTSLSGLDMKFTADGNGATLDFTAVSNSNMSVVFANGITNTNLSVGTLDAGTTLDVESNNAAKKLSFLTGSSLGNTAFSVDNNKLNFTATADGTYNLGTGTTNANMNYGNVTVNSALSAVEGMTFTATTNNGTLNLTGFTNSSAIVNFGSGVTNTNVSMATLTEGSGLSVVSDDKVMVFGKDSKFGKSEFAVENDVLNLTGTSEGVYNFVEGTANANMNYGGYTVNTSLSAVKGMTFTATANNGTLNLTGFSSSSASVVIKSDVNNTNVSVGTLADGSALAVTSGSNVAEFLEGSTLGNTAFSAEDNLQFTGVSGGVYNFGTSTTGAEMFYKEGTVHSSISDITMNYTAASGGATLDLTSVTNATANVKLAGGVTTTNVSAAVLDDESAIKVANNNNTHVMAFTEGTKLGNTAFSNTNEKLQLAANNGGVYNFGTGTTGAEVLLNTAGSVNTGLSGVGDITYTALSKVDLNITDFTKSHASISLDEDAYGTNISMVEMGDGSSLSLTGEGGYEAVLATGTTLNRTKILWNENDNLAFDAADDSTLYFGTGTSGVQVKVGENVTTNVSLANLVDTTFTVKNDDGKHKVVFTEDTDFNATAFSDDGNKLNFNGADGGIYNIGTGTTNANMNYGDVTVKASLSSVSDMTFTATKDGGTLTLTGISESTANVKFGTGVTNTNVSAIELAEGSNLNVKADNKLAAFTKGTTLGNTEFTDENGKLNFTGKNGSTYNLITGTTGVNMNYGAGTFKSALSGVGDMTFTATADGGKLNLTGITASNADVVLNGAKKTNVSAGLLDANSTLEVQTADGKVAAFTKDTKLGDVAFENDGSKLNFNAVDGGIYNLGKNTANVNMNYGKVTVSSGLSGVDDMTFTATTNGGTLNITELNNSNASVVINGNFSTNVSADALTGDVLTVQNAEGSNAAAFTKDTDFGDTKFINDEDKLSFDANSGKTYNLGEGTKNANMNYGAGTYNTGLSGVGDMTYTATHNNGTLNITELDDSKANVVLKAGVTKTNVSAVELEGESALSVANSDGSHVAAFTTGTELNDIKFTNSNDKLSFDAKNGGTYNLGEDTKKAEVRLNTAGITVHTGISGVSDADGITYNVKKKATLDVTDFTNSHASISLDEDAYGTQISMVNMDNSSLSITGEGGYAANLLNGTELNGTKILWNATDNLAFDAANDSTLYFGTGTSGVTTIVENDEDTNISLAKLGDTTFTVRNGAEKGQAKAVFTEGTEFDETNIANGSADELTLTAADNATYNFGEGTDKVSVKLDEKGMEVNTSLSDANVAYNVNAKATLNINDDVKDSNATVSLAGGAVGSEITLGALDYSSVSIYGDETSLANFGENTDLNGGKITFNDDKTLAIEGKNGALMNFNEGTTGVSVALEGGDVTAKLDGVKDIAFNAGSASVNLNVAKIDDSNATINLGEDAAGSTVNLENFKGDSSVSVYGGDDAIANFGEDTSLKGGAIAFDGDTLTIEGKAGATMNFNDDTKGVEAYINEEGGVNTNLSGVDDVEFNVNKKVALNIDKFDESNAVVSLSGSARGSVIDIDDALDEDSNLKVTTENDSAAVELLGGSDLKDGKVAWEDGEPLTVEATDGAVLNFGDNTHDAVAYLGDGAKDGKVESSLSGVESITFDVDRKTTLDLTSATVVDSNATISFQTSAGGANVLLDDVDDKSSVALQSSDKSTVANILGGSDLNGSEVEYTDKDKLKINANANSDLKLGGGSENVDVILDEAGEFNTSLADSEDITYTATSAAELTLDKVENSDVTINLDEGSKGSKVTVENADEDSEILIDANDDAEITMSGVGIETLKLGADEDLNLEVNNWAFNDGDDKANILDIGDGAPSLMSGSIADGVATLNVGSNEVVMTATTAELADGVRLDVVSGDDTYKAMILNDDYALKADDDISEVDIFMGKTLDLGESTAKTKITLGKDFGDESAFTDDAAYYNGVTTVIGSSKAASFIIGDLADNAVEIHGMSNGDSLYAGGSTADNTITSAAGKRAYIGTSANSGRTHLDMNDKAYGFIGVDGETEATADVIALMRNGGSYINVEDAGNGKVNYQFGTDASNYVSIDNLTAGEYTTWYNDNMVVNDNKKVKIDATLTGDGLTYSDDVKFYLGNGLGNSKLTMSEGDSNKKVNYDGGAVLMEIYEIDGSNGGDGNYLQAAADVKSTVRASNTGATTISGGQTNGVDSASDTLIGGESGATTFVVGSEMGNDVITGLKTGDTIKFLSGKYADIAGKGIKVENTVLTADFGAGKAKLNATAKTTMADVKDLTVEFTDATLTWDGENWNQVNK